MTKWMPEVSLLPNLNLIDLSDLPRPKLLPPTQTDFMFPKVWFLDNGRTVKSVVIGGWLAIEDGKRIY